MTRVRAFLAIPLPRELKSSIRDLQGSLRAKIPAVRWTSPENLHLTLHFFGDVTQETLEKIKVSVLSVKRCHRPLLVEVKGLGAFPNPRRPRIIWLGLEPKDPLRRLHKDYQNVLQRIGVTTEVQDYTPHLTIGRLRQQKPDLTDLFKSVGHTLIGQLPIDKLVLFESRFFSGGTEHIPLLTVKLDETTEH
jgi:2'-5' RNA ligase